MLPDAQLASDVFYVEPGQLLVSTEPCTLRTVLGSCVSVCLYDPELRMGGMNHFMLPRALVAGSEPRRLCASVFGGARVLSSMSDVMHLGRRNAEYALDWLAEAGIPIVASDLEGNVGRRLDFHIGSGTTSVRVLGAR